MEGHTSRKRAREPEAPAAAAASWGGGHSADAAEQLPTQEQQLLLRLALGHGEQQQDATTASGTELSEEEGETEAEHHEGGQGAAAAGGRAAGGRAAGAAGGRTHGGPNDKHAERHTVKKLNYLRRQHTMNLVALLRQYALQRNVPRLAGVAALLLAAQGSRKPHKLKSEGAGQPTEAQARLAEVLTTSYAAIAEGWPPPAAGAPAAPTADQLRRLLRQAHAFMPTPAAKDGVALELARLALAQGQLSDAYDVLQAMPPRPGGGGPLEFDRALLLGLIRHAQWAQAMQRSESRRGGGGGGGDGSGPSPGFDAFSYNPSQWARAGRVARELFAEAGEHLKAACRLRPGSTELAYLLAQRALCTEGGVAAAAAIAQQHRAAAPADVDTHALHALFLVMLRPGGAAGAGAAGGGWGGAVVQPGGGEDEEGGPAEGAAQQINGGVAALLGCLECMLRCDPGNEAAMAAFLELYEAGALPPSDQLRLLCAYLDGVPASAAPAPLQLKAWQMLAERVLDAVPRLLAAHAAVQQTQRALSCHLRTLVPEVGAANQQDSRRPFGQQQPQERSKGGDSSDEEGGLGSQAPAATAAAPAASTGIETGQQQQQQQQLSPADANALYRQLGPQQRELDGALAEWREVVGHLQGRLWWRGHHFAPQEPEQLVLALRAGRAVVEVLEAQAAVAAVVHGMWVQACTAAVASRNQPLPSFMRDGFTRGVQRALRRHGAAGAADAVRRCFRDSAQVFRVARGLARYPRFAVLGRLAQQARHRADFWRAARKPWAPPPSWLSVPLGQAHPPLGPVSGLHPAWWRTFPQARRPAHAGGGG